MSFRNEYDVDVTIFSPEGNILQLDYANNASTRGNIMIGIKSINHLIMGAINAKSNQNFDQTNKIFSINKNIGITVSGIISDGKIAHKYLEKIKQEYEQGNNRTVLISCLITNCLKFFSLNTFQIKNRPFGIKLIMGGFDIKGPQLFDLYLDGTVQKVNKIITGSNSQFKMQSIEKYYDFFYKKIKYSGFDELFFYFIFPIENNCIEKMKNNLWKENIHIGFLGKKIEWLILDYNFKIFIIKIYKNNYFGKRNFTEFKIFKNFSLEKINCATFFFIKPFFEKIFNIIFKFKTKNIIFFFNDLL